MRINDFKRIKYLSKITFDCSPPMREESIRKRHFWRFCPRMTILCVQYVRNPMVEPGVFFNFWCFFTDSSVWENWFRLYSAHQRALFQTEIINFTHNFQLLPTVVTPKWLFLDNFGCSLFLHRIHYLVGYIGKSLRSWLFFLRPMSYFLDWYRPKKWGRFHWKNG